MGDGTSNTTNLQHFNKTSDTVIITATNQDWSRLTGQATAASTPFVRSLASVSKGYKSTDPIGKINRDGYSVFNVPYGL